MSAQTELSASTTSKLFEPLRVGRMELKHRIAMAPLTRFRADSKHVPPELMRIYYEQRASTPGKRRRRSLTI